MITSYSNCYEELKLFTSHGKYNMQHITIEAENNKSNKDVMIIIIIMHYINTQILKIIILF